MPGQLTLPLTDVILRRAQLFQNQPGALVKALTAFGQRDAFTPAHEKLRRHAAALTPLLDDLSCPLPPALSQIIRTRRELGMKARALTAEGRTASKVIAAVPLCIMLALWIINPEYIGVLFSTPQGHTILYVAAAMGTAGLLLINRIARLEA